MNAPKQPPRRKPDPWLDLAPAVIVEMLAARDWPVRVSAEGASLALGAEPGSFALLICAGREGLAALRALAAAHPEGKIRGPRWVEDGCSLTVVRQGDTPVHTCDLVAGVRVLASGAVPIPPSADGAVQKAWTLDAHAATVEAAALPAWVASIARDPDARRAAEHVAARAVLAETSPPSGSASQDAKSAAAMPADSAWELQLVRSGRGVKNTFGNLCKIFRCAPEFAGRLRLNLMTQRVEIDGTPLPEEHVGRVRERVEDAPWGGFAPGKDHVFDAIRTVAGERRYHPVREYLEGLVWDGESRIDKVIERVLRVPDLTISPVMRAMVRKWFISAVARALNPGVKCDTALVLQGAQGLKKSTFFAILGGAWFGDTEIRIGDKDGLQQIHANWITEWGELDRITNSRHAAEVKAFVARMRDDFRPPYGRNVETFERSCVIVGSVNPTAFLNDPTGSRRFWVIRVVRTIDVTLLREWKDQLWAEAVAAFRTGEIFYLDDEDERAREEAAEAFRARDPWEAEIGQWLRRTPHLDGWRKASSESGRAHIQTIDVLRGALHLEPKDCRRETETRVSDALRALGYVNKRIRLKASEVKAYEDAGRVDAKGRIYAWVPTESISTPELDASVEITFEGAPEPTGGEGEWTEDP